LLKKERESICSVFKCPLVQYKSSRSPEISFLNNRPNSNKNSPNLSIIRVASFKIKVNFPIKGLNSDNDSTFINYQCFLTVRRIRRQGAKVKKIHDTSKILCQRLLESLDIPEEVKAQLQKAFNEINPAALKREIDRLLKELTKAYLKKRVEPRTN